MLGRVEMHALISPDGGITLIDQCVCMIIPNFAKKGCILKVCSGTQTYAI